MTTITAPAPQTDSASNNGEKPISLFQLGCLFVIRVSYWSCRIGNEPQDFNLSSSEIESRAIASFGSKELIDPEQGRKVFQQIEKQARHQLGKYSRPFPAANAHFVPWDHVPELIGQLQALQVEFGQAVEGPVLVEWQRWRQQMGNVGYTAFLTGFYGYPDNLIVNDAPWETIPGDFDRDGDVDLNDFATFALYFTG